MRCQYLHPPNDEQCRASQMRGTDLCRCHEASRAIERLYPSPSVLRQIILAYAQCTLPMLVVGFVLIFCASPSVETFSEGLLLAGVAGMALAMSGIVPHRPLSGLRIWGGLWLWAQVALSVGAFCSAAYLVLVDSALPLSIQSARIADLLPKVLASHRHLPPGVVVYERPLEAVAFVLVAVATEQFSTHLLVRGRPLEVHLDGVALLGGACLVLLAFRQILQTITG
jgi:hypothetical protein